MSEASYSLRSGNMSRIGKQIITIPSGVEAKIEGSLIKVKGPKGELARTIDPRLTVTITGSEMTVAKGKDDQTLSPLWGTYAAHISNMVEGVSKGFTKKLQIEGIGYKAEVKGSDIVMGLGFSHPVVIRIPTGLKVAVDKGIIAVEGIDKEAVGSFAAILREKKKPEPYKGKGIRYEGERVIMKQGKKTA